MRTKPIKIPDSRETTTLVQTYRLAIPSMSFSLDLSTYADYPSLAESYAQKGYDPLVLIDAFVDGLQRAGISSELQEIHVDRVEKVFHAE